MQNAPSLLKIRKAPMVESVIYSYANNWTNKAPDNEEPLELQHILSKIQTDVICPLSITKVISCLYCNV